MRSRLPGWASEVVARETLRRTCCVACAASAAPPRAPCRLQPPQHSVCGAGDPLKRRTPESPSSRCGRTFAGSGRHGRRLRPSAALRVSSPGQTGGARRRRDGYGDECPAVRRCAESSRALLHANSRTTSLPTSRTAGCQLLVVSWCRLYDRRRWAGMLAIVRSFDGRVSEQHHRSRQPYRIGIRRGPNIPRALMCLGGSLAAREMRPRTIILLSGWRFP